MDSGIIVLSIVGLILLALVIILVVIYNGFVRMLNNIEKSWANIDVLLKQRSSELPNLIAAVKGYMTYEKETLTSLTKLRSLLDAAETLSQKAAADAAISGLLKTVFAVAEQYPDLKAGEQFLALQHRISGLENELADRREFYNDSVTIYNTRRQSIPDILMAKLMHLEKKELFKASVQDSQYIEVRLGK